MGTTLNSNVNSQYNSQFKNEVFQIYEINSENIEMLSYWWLIELHYWFKSVFFAKIWEIYRMQYAKDDFMQGEIQGKIELNIRKLEKLWNLWNFMSFSSFPNFPMFGSIWLPLGWISPCIKSHRMNAWEVKLTPGEI